MDDLQVSRTINTQNTTPTAENGPDGSTVTLRGIDNASTLSIQVSGTYSGALTLQGRVEENGPWVSMAGVPLLNVGTGNYSGNIGSGTQGIFQADIAAFRDIRITTFGVVTGAAKVSMKATQAAGMVALDAALPAGGNNIGSVNIATLPVPVNLSLTSAATTNATSAKTSPGMLYDISADNLSASVRWLKLYNKASAPTVGTDVPVLTIPIPANGHVTVPFGNVGRRFTTGLAYAITAAQAVADTTAIGAGEVHVWGSYI